MIPIRKAAATHTEANPERPIPWVKVLGRVGLYLGLTLGAVIVLGPFIWTVYASFVPNDLDLGKHTANVFGLDNYVTLFADSEISRWWANSLLVTAVILLGNLVFNTAAGYALARLRLPGRRVLFGIVLLTMIIPPQVLFVPIYTLIIQVGWLNTYMALIIPFLVNPFGVFLMKQFFESFPDELADAGSIDGLGHLGIYFRLAIPVASPAIAAQAIFIFVWNWNTFIFPSVLATSPDMFTLPVGIYQLTHTAFTNHIALSMAGVAVTTIPALVVFAIMQRRFIQTLAGSAKS